MTPLIFAARHGSWVLVAGLCAGLAMPSLAQYLLAWIPHMVVALLFLAVFRMDPGNIAGSLKELPSVALVALGLQLVLPLAILGAAYALGCADTALVTALVIMSAAPSIVGIPTLCILLGRSPVLAMRLLVVGTAVLPVTILPVFLLLPQLGDVQGVLIASLRLLGAIVITASVAGGLRRAFLPTPTGGIGRHFCDRAGHFCDRPDVAAGGYDFQRTARGRFLAGRRICGEFRPADRVLLASQVPRVTRSRIRRVPYRGQSQCFAFPCRACACGRRPDPCVCGLLPDSDVPDAAGDAAFVPSGAIAVTTPRISQPGDQIPPMIRVRFGFHGGGFQSATCQTAELHTNYTAIFINCRDWTWGGRGASVAF
jgi:hypothetical protein